MTPALEALLAHAYGLDQVEGNRAAAILYLKKGIREGIAADPALASEITMAHARLAGVVEARRHGERDGDHVSAVFLALLTAAMGEGS